MGLLIVGTGVIGKPVRKLLEQVRSFIVAVALTADLRGFGVRQAAGKHNCRACLVRGVRGLVRQRILMLRNVLVSRTVAGGTRDSQFRHLTGEHVTVFIITRSSSLSVAL